MQCKHKTIESVSVIGGRTISGRVRVSGFKIGAVPIVAGTFLTEDDVELENLPDIADVNVLLNIIQKLGGRVHKNGSITMISTRNATPDVPLPSELVASVHGTIYLLPALLARFGRVRLPSTFGGCVIGQRPIEHILHVLEQFGASVSHTQDSIEAYLPQKLMGASIDAQTSLEHDKYRSGATKTAMLLGATATGTTFISNAYTRASITELAAFLQCLGGNISGAGSPSITVEGETLHSGSYHLCGDYIEAITFLILLAVCRGEIVIEGFSPHHCEPEIELLQRMGLKIYLDNDKVHAICDHRVLGVNFSTTIIDTDCQPLFGAALVTAVGTSQIFEHVWESRFGYAEELLRLGARCKFMQQELRIEGVPTLFAGRVVGADVRGSAALLVAAAGAKGRTEVSGLFHLERGYDQLVEKLISLGVEIVNHV